MTVQACSYTVKDSGRYWRLKYRDGGKERSIALGVYPDVGLKEAREKAEAACKMLQSGDDPGEVKKADKARQAHEAANTFKAVAQDWLMYQAGRVLQRVQAVYRWAVTHGRIEASPMDSLVPREILKPREVQHRAALSERELPAFLAQLDAYAGDPTTINALRFLMLTAVRPGEVRGARWAQIDQDAALWTIPAERMKMRTEHRVPLSRQALQVLQAMEPISGDRDLVFPSPTYRSKPLSENTFNGALRRMGYPNATAHGFRSLFSTVTNEKDRTMGEVIERALAHQDRNKVRAAYLRSTFLNDRVKLMQTWADHLDALRKGAEVIQLHKAA